MRERPVAIGDASSRAVGYRFPARAGADGVAMRAATRSPVRAGVVPTSLPMKVHRGVAGKYAEAAMGIACAFVVWLIVGAVTAAGAGVVVAFMVWSFAAGSRRVVRRRTRHDGSRHLDVSRICGADGGDGGSARSG